MYLERPKFSTPPTENPQKLDVATVRFPMLFLTPCSPTYRFSTYGWAHALVRRASAVITNRMVACFVCVFAEVDLEYGACAAIWLWTPDPYPLLGQRASPAPRVFYPEQPAISLKKNTVFFSANTKTQNTKGHIPHTHPVEKPHVCPPGFRRVGYIFRFDGPCCTFSPCMVCPAAGREAVIRDEPMECTKPSGKDRGVDGGERLSFRQI